MTLAAFAFVAPLTARAAAGVKLKCPGCQAEHTHEGVVTQEDLRARLAAKDTAAAELSRQLAARADYDTLKGKLVEYEAEKTKAAEAAERNAAYDAAGIPATPEIRAAFDLFYQAAAAGAEEGKVPARADWLADEATKAHPVLGPNLGKVKPGTTTTTTAQAANGRQVATKAVPQTETGAVVGAPGSRTFKSPAELRNYFQSPEFRSMKAEDQTRMMGELEAQLVSSQGAAG